MSHKHITKIELPFGETIIRHEPLDTHGYIDREKSYGMNNTRVLTVNVFKETNEQLLELAELLDEHTRSSIARAILNIHVPQYLQEVKDYLEANPTEAPETTEDPAEMLERLLGAS